MATQCPAEEDSVYEYRSAFVCVCVCPSIEKQMELVLRCVYHGSWSKPSVHAEGTGGS